MMLEWSICNNCGKILDNSQTTCQSCGSEVEKVHMDYLNDYLNNFMFLVKTVNVFSDFSQSLEDIENANLHTIVLDDLFKWFSYLGLGDGKITENELEFINSLLNTTYTKEDILNLADLKDDSDIPLSFVALHEIDLFARRYDMDNISSCAQLFDCYKFLGKFFITVDDDLNSDVLNLYQSYMAKLKGYLDENDIDTHITDTSVVITEKPQEKEDVKSLDDYIADLNKLVGLEKVKKDVNSLINLVRIRKLRSDRGITDSDEPSSCIFRKSRNR